MVYAFAVLSSMGWYLVVAVLVFIVSLLGLWALLLTRRRRRRAAEAAKAASAAAMAKTTMAKTRSPRSPKIVPVTGDGDGKTVRFGGEATSRPHSPAAFAEQTAR